ncbi:MAG: hypothetical protein V1848_02375 [Candidatus Magasanikbacteria bacterium]
MQKKKQILIFFGIIIALVLSLFLFFIFRRDRIPQVEYTYQEPVSPKEVVDAYRDSVKKLQGDILLSSQANEGLMQLAVARLETMVTPAQNREAHMRVYLAIMNSEKQGEEFRVFLNEQIQSLLNEIE